MDNLSQFLLSSRRMKEELAFNGFFLFIFLRYHFLCPCQADHSVYVLFCVFHMLLPALLCFFFSLVLNVLRARASNTTRGGGCCCTGKLCCAVLLRALSMGLLWVILLLFDGDWYVCLMTHSDKADDQQLACKQEANMSQKEKSDVTHYVNMSRVIAMVLTLVMVTVWLCTATPIKPPRRRNNEDEDEEENLFL